MGGGIGGRGAGMVGAPQELLRLCWHCDAPCVVGTVGELHQKLRETAAGATTAQKSADEVRGGD